MKKRHYTAPLAHTLPLAPAAPLAESIPLGDNRDPDAEQMTREEFPTSPWDTDW